jgi:hypothetical protein
MKRNVGIGDRLIRFGLGAVFAVLAFAVGAFWLKILLGVAAVIAVMTGLTRFCLLYVPFSINTTHALKAPEETQANTASGS